MKKKVLNFVTQHLPVSRKIYEKNLADLKAVNTLCIENMKHITEVLTGLEVADAHHSQMELAFVQQFQQLKMPKKKTENRKKEFDPAFN